MLEIEPGLIFWTTVSFALLVILMYRWALPPLLALLKEREKIISDALLSADETRKRSEDVLASVKQKLTETNETAQKMVEQAKLEGKRMKDEILSVAKREAELLSLQAKEDLQREKNEILSEIKKQTADLIVAAAGRVLGKKIDKNENARLIDESLKNAKLN